jgi:sugar O-acyltransferase (sialic acid O-acetyltransferase NeuD family)
MILIVGAGGHGQVVADIFRARRAQGCGGERTAFVDDDPSRHGLTLVDSAVLGGVGQLSVVPHAGVIVAIGDNRGRARMFATLARGGERFTVARHPQSVVAEDVAIGDGAMLCAGTIVNTGSIIGENTIINTGATVDHHTVIGDHVHIAPGVHMGGEVRVGEGAFIGIGAVVLPRVTIGAWSTVGAGAVVTRNVAPGATVAGVPARPVRAAAAV